MKSWYLSFFFFYKILIIIHLSFAMLQILCIVTRSHTATTMFIMYWLHACRLSHWSISFEYDSEGFFQRNAVYLQVFTKGYSNIRSMTHLHPDTTVSSLSASPFPETSLLTMAMWKDLYPGTVLSEGCMSALWRLVASSSACSCSPGSFWSVLTAGSGVSACTFLIQ